MAATQNTQTEIASNTSTESDSDEYGTPAWLIDRLQEHLQDGVFDLDAAAGAEATQIAQWRFTKQDDALADTTDWLYPTAEAGYGDVDSVFLNPPFSDPLPFLRRFTEAIDPDDPSKASFGVTITRADTTTEWFQTHVSQATAIWFHDSRFSFYNPDGTSDSAGFACVVGLYGDVPDSLLADLAQDGQFYSRDNVEPAQQQQSLSELESIGEERDERDGVVLATSANEPTAELGVVVPGDVIHITVTQNDLVGDAPEKMTVQVLPDGKALLNGGECVEIHATGVTSSGEDVCVQLRDNISTGIELAVAVDMEHWQVLTPREIRVTNGDRDE